MLNKIIYTILGFGLAFLILPHPAHDASRQALVSGASTSTALASPGTTAPEMASDQPAPTLTAKAALAFDFDSGTVLYSKNLDERLPIASLTKLVTALVVLDHTKPDDIVTVTKADQTPIGSILGLADGEQLTVESLLKGLLIPSANDAAITLANYVGGDLETFRTEMNAKAKELGLVDTQFANPVGWDSDENYSNTLDLVKIVQEVVRHDSLMQIVGTRQTTIDSVDQKYEHQLTTTNELMLDDPEIIGMKTGFTSKALGNLIILDNHNNHRVLTIVLGSENREGDTQALLDWLFGVYRW